MLNKSRKITRLFFYLSISIRLRNFAPNEHTGLHTIGT